MGINDSSQRAHGLPAAAERVVQPTSYRETPAVSVENLDVLEQLRGNLDLLEDLHGQLRFVLGEIKTHLPRR